MKIRELLALLEDNGPGKYVYSTGDEVVTLGGELIPKEDIAYQVIPYPGYYKLVKVNCKSDLCDIGKPHPTCIERKMYKPKKCAVWGLTNIEDASVSLDISGLLVLMNKALDCK